MKKLYEKAKKLVENRPWLLAIPLAIWGITSIILAIAATFKDSMFALTSSFCGVFCLLTVGGLIGLITENPSLMFHGSGRPHDDMEQIIDRQRRNTAVLLLISSGLFIIQALAFVIEGIIFLVSLI